MDEYEQYLADADYEDYLNGIQQEDRRQAVQRNRPFEQPGSVGPDYNQGYLANAGKSIAEIPEAMWNFAGDAYNFLNPFANGGAGGPVDTMRRAGVENTARVAGGLGAGTAGALTGAGAGAFLGPLGAAVGGGLGFGAGMLGFDVATDAASDLATGSEQYMRPYDQYMKDLTYNATQGVAGNLAGVGVAKAARRVGNPFSADRAEMKAADKLMELQPDITPEMIDAQLAETWGDPFQQFKTTPELLGSDALKNAQRTVAKSGIEQYGRTAERLRARDNAYLQGLDDIEPATTMIDGEPVAPMSIDEIQTGARAAIENKLAASQAELTEAEMAVQDSLNNLRPGIDASEAGGQIREGFEGYKQGLDTRITKEFGKMGTGQVDIAPVAQVADALKTKYFRDVGLQPDHPLSKLFKDLNRQGEESGLIQIIDGEEVRATSPAKYTLPDIQAIRNEALTVAQHSGDRQISSVAGQIADALKKAGDDAVKTGKVAKEEAAAWNEGIRLRKEKGTKLESSAVPAKAILAKQPYGEYKMPESTIPSKIWRKGEKGVREGFRNYRETVGATEQAMEPIYRYATDSFRERVINTNGTVNRKAYEGWMKDHKIALDENPALREQFATVERAQAFLEQKFGDLKRTEADVQKSALKYFLDADPEVAISKMLEGKDAIKRTKATAEYLRRNDKDALKGLARGVTDYLKKKTFIPDGKVSIDAALTGEVFDGTVQRGKLKQEWERIKPAVEKAGIYTDSQLKLMDHLYKDLASGMSIGKAVIKDGSDTAQNLSAMASLYKMGRTGFLRSVPGGRYFQMIEPILQAIPEARYLEAFEEALLNPLYARDLLQRASNKNVAKAAEMVFGKEISAAGLGAMSLGQDSKKPMAAQPQMPQQAAPVVEEEQKLDPNIPSYLQRETNATKQLNKTAAPPKQSAVTSTETMPRPEALLNPESKARAMAESRGNPYTKPSSAGAEGLMQIMPATGKWIGEKLGETYKPLRANMTPSEKQQSIEQNIRFSEWYFNHLMGRYKGRTTLARAAYNAGPARVDNAMARASDPSNDRIVLNNLPSGVKKETIPYVQRINEIIQRYQ